jgi:hypothetical protein
MIDNLGGGYEIVEALIRFSFLIAALVVSAPIGLCAGPASADERHPYEGPWCAQINTGAGRVEEDCTFVSFEACRGIDGLTDTLKMRVRLKGINRTDSKTPVAGARQFEFYVQSRSICELSEARGDSFKHGGGLGVLLEF